MTWAEKFMLISTVSISIVNLATALWTMLRACQTYRIVKGKH